MDYQISLINWYPPFLFSGIKVIKRSQDMRQLTMRLRLRFWNSNYYGTQYGGSLYSMTDPIYVLMLLSNLGPGYSIWNKAGSIRFLKPGRTDAFAEFTISEEDLDQIRASLKDRESMEWVRTIPIKDTSGEKIAEVEQTISIKKQKPKV